MKCIELNTSLSIKNSLYPFFHLVKKDNNKLYVEELNEESKKFSVFKLVKGLSGMYIILMELDDEEYYLVGTDDSDDITLELKSSWNI